jgi:predicted NACHT family NTPase
MAELLKEPSLENFERFSLGGVQEDRVPGLDAVDRYSKLMILGKPGSGKTTFLKYLAIQCSGEIFKPELVPIFITLKDYAEAPGQPNLLDYLIQLFTAYGVEPTTKVKTDFLNALWQGNASAVEQLLRQGRILVLLDGLDEVKAADNSRVLSQIRYFADRFHKNPFVITCRIAAREYTFERFTEVEVADFDDQQIATFTNKWFQAKQDPVKAERFIQKLKEESRIRDLASSPLLLTLLCLVFEESGSFPSNRSELYKEGLDVLLKKWDVKRNIERKQVYKNLSLKRKEDLLSQIALNTFEQGNYFFKQKEVEREIVQYIRNLPDANSAEDDLQLDSEEVLKSIESQHGLFVERARGIYSFSHLTFHEYFTARKIVSRLHTDPSWEQLTTHITEKRWREVFLLTVEILDNADTLLQSMKQQIDDRLAGDEKLQQFLTWVEQKSSSVTAPYKPAAIRAFYYALDLARDLDRDRDLALDLALDRDLDRDRDLALDLALDPELQRSLQSLKDQLLENSRENRENFKQWWQTNGTAWTEDFRAILIQYRNIGHDWQFTDSQKQLLREYYDANKLLVNCLNSDCYVSREVRQEIEDNLLLPVKRQE